MMFLFSSLIHRTAARPPAVAACCGNASDETPPPTAGNFLGAKLSREQIRQCEFSAAMPTVLSTITSVASEEMFCDDIKITLSLLELEDEEADEDSTQHQHHEENMPVVMMPAKLTDHAPLPSLASSLCSLSEGLREEEDEEFTLLSDHDRTTKVAFSSVNVRQYTITVGDHPCCNTGYALSLDWDYEALPEQSLEAYEAGHGQRRNLTELLTSYEERRSRLEECADDCDAVKRLNRRLERQKCRNHRAVDTFFS
jgi:hypothetical protein